MSKPDKKSDGGHAIQQYDKSHTTTGVSISLAL
jgi:hypothetical protein